MRDVVNRNFEVTLWREFKAILQQIEQDLKNSLSVAYDHFFLKLRINPDILLELLLAHVERHHLEHFLADFVGVEGFIVESELFLSQLKIVKSVW